MPKRKAFGFAQYLSSVVQLVVFSIVGLLGWEAIVRFGEIPKYLIPTPSSVLQYMVEHPGYLLYHSWITLEETALGFVGGAFLGIASGVGIHFSAYLRKTLYPILIAFNTIPKVALAPLFLVWFGFGLLPKVLIALLIAFFPLVVSTIDGLAAVPAELIELAVLFRASQWHKFWKVSFIHSLPYVFTGAKVSIANAVGGAVVAEFIGSNTGLGYIVVMANTSGNLASMFASFLLLTIMALGMFWFMERIESTTIPWARY
jgi:NitT/TauT family transport system permease protein